MIHFSALLVCTISLALHWLLVLLFHSKTSGRVEVEVGSEVGVGVEVAVGVGVEIAAWTAARRNNYSRVLSIQLQHQPRPTKHAATILLVIMP